MSRKSSPDYEKFVMENIELILGIFPNLTGEQRTALEWIFQAGNAAGIRQATAIFDSLERKLQTDAQDRQESLS